jgi:hypothetical protein
MGLLNANVTLEHFFKTNPKDYFFINPNRRTLNISKERFNELLNFMMDAFHQHNTQLENILRRGLARKKVYLGDPNLLLSDFRKALKWLLKV